MPPAERTQRTIQRTIIGVMGPAACDDQTAELARAVGKEVAARGAVLLTGGRTGVMEAASREARNWVNVCASDALIAVGGGFGTLSEIALALKARKPVVLLGSWRFEMEGVSPTVPRARDAAHAVELAFATLDSARG